MTAPESVHESKRIAFVVAYLDSVKNWIDPIWPFLHAAGYEVLILHMQSLNYGLAKRDVVVRPEYKLIDLGRKNAPEILQILEREKLAAIGFLNFQSWIELLLIGIARVAGITTFYMQHGHFNQLTFKRGMSNKKSSFLRYVQLSRKALSYLFRVSDRPAGDLYALLRATSVSDYRNLKPDHALLFSKDSLRVLQKHFQFVEDRVHFTGFPIVNYRHELASIGTDSDVTGKTVLYVHQAFVRNRLTSISYAQEVEYLSGIARMCQELDCNLIVKLHPRESLTNYQPLQQNRTVRLELETSLAKLVQESNLVIGQSSTALFCPILFRKPLVIAYYPGLKEWEPLFEPVSLRAANEDELFNILSDPTSWRTRLECYDEFIEQHIGSNCSYEYLAATIDRIASAVVPKSSLTRAL